uniref:Uncharacterized protein n=1 Tax=Setaria italica TaxID=4555 RepID=K3Z219_SETIT
MMMKFSDVLFHCITHNHWFASLHFFVTVICPDSIIRICFCICQIITITYKVGLFSYA